MQPHQEPHRTPSKNTLTKAIKWLYCSPHKERALVIMSSDIADPSRCYVEFFFCQKLMQFIIGRTDPDTGILQMHQFLVKEKLTPEYIKQKLRYIDVGPNSAFFYISGDKYKGLPWADMDPD